MRVLSKGVLSQVREFEGPLFATEVFDLKAGATSADVNVRKDTLTN
jgi:hypothetical protein